MFLEIAICDKGRVGPATTIYFNDVDGIAFKSR